MQNYKLTVAYDGTNYCGWQIQPNGISIQEILEEKLKIIVREQVKIIGSGRTDSGVHALGQTANFKIDKDIDLYRFLASINALLPSDIRVLEALKIDPDFHSRYSASGKVYRYHLHLDRVMDPFKRLYCWHLLEKIDLDLLKLAATQFLGTHDFTSLSNEAHRGVAAHDAIRTIKRLNIIEEPGGFYFEFEADGFLYKMVRNIVGLLVDIAIGKILLSQIPVIIAAKDRTLSGRAAPALGLFLVTVHYPIKL